MKSIPKEMIDKMRNPEVSMPPAPHYPNWIMFCPDCQNWWESELYHYHYVVTCFDCRRII